MNNTHFTYGSIKRKPNECGLSIEEQVRQAIATNQPIEGNAPMIYTPAKEGVRAEYDVRTDKHDLALQANDKFQASDRMKSFMEQIETDADGYDGAGNKVESQKSED